MRFPSQESGRSDLKADLYFSNQLLPHLSHLTHRESIQLHLQAHSHGQRGPSKTPCQGKAFEPIRSHLHSITSHVTGNPIQRHLVEEETDLNVTMDDLKKLRPFKYSERSRNTLRSVCKVAICAWHTYNLKLH